MEDVKDLEQKQYNEIDMECDIDMDEDDFGGFGSANITSNSEPIDEVGDDGRPLDTHTGIIINFGDSDDEIEFNPTELEVIDSKPLVVQDEQDILNAKNGLLGQENFDRNDFTGINEIDMECEVGEDDDLDDSYFTSPKGGYIDFGDDEDEDYLNDKELVDEELINEKRKKFRDYISQGKVEDDYYEKLKKRHAATNKKGAYNTSFHFAGNPKLEMDDFNHMMGSDGGNIPSVPNITTSLAGGGDDSPTFGGDMGGGECCAESLNEEMDYSKLFNDLLAIVGFDLTGDKGNYILKDKYSKVCSEPCKSTDDIKVFLTPYIQDCFIIPLQVETGKDFNDCKEWADWYNKEGSKEYPQCKQDVKYCDLYANHLNECNLF